MVQQDKDALDVRPLLKALQLLLIPADLRTPLGYWQSTRVRIEKNEPQRPVGSREPVASLKVGKAGKEVPQSRLPHNAIVVVPQEREDRHTCVIQGRRQCVERAPVRRGGTTEDQVSYNRQKVWDLHSDLLDELHALLGI